MGSRGKGWGLLKGGVKLEGDDRDFHLGYLGGLGYISICACLAAN